MSKYYCHRCALETGTLKPLATLELTGSSYSLDKFVKHTAPTGTHAINSIFADGSYSAYRDYVVNAHASGSVEIDDRERINVVWVAAAKTGVCWAGSEIVAETDSVKLVLHDELKVHAYPTGSGEFSTATCARCGEPIIT